VLLADQNAAAVLPKADRCYVLRGGRIVMEGPAASLSNPALMQALLVG
jgi:ABC-type branched-subunit amino acid transport system ATPase component